MLAAPPVPAAELDAEHAAAAAELPGRKLLAVRAPWSAAMGRRRVFSLDFRLARWCSLSIAGGSQAARRIRRCSFLLDRRCCFHCSDSENPSPCRCKVATKLTPSLASAALIKWLTRC